MPSQHMYCERVWNLIQIFDVQFSNWKLYISIRLSLEVQNFHMKIFDLIRYRTLDPLNQRQTCYHLSQCGGYVLYVKFLSH